MNAVSTYIENKDYRSLISEIMSSDYNYNDRVSVYKYVKRVCSQEVLSGSELFVPFLKLRIATKIFPTVQEIEWISESTAFVKNSFFSSMIDFCTLPEIIQYVPTSMYKDEKLLNFFLNHEKSDSKEFVDYLFTIFDFSQINETFFFNDKNNDIKLVIKSYVVKNPYFFSKLFYMLKNEETNNFVMKQLLRFYIFHSSRCTEKQFVAITKCFDIKEIFSPVTIESYFMQACENNYLQMATIILKSGYKKITDGFTAAVSRGHDSIVELVLPYKPRLERAWEICNYSDQSLIGKMIADARSKTKKKSPVSDEGP